MAIKIYKIPVTKNNITFFLKVSTNYYCGVKKGTTIYIWSGRVNILLLYIYLKLLLIIVLYFYHLLLLFIIIIILYI